MASIKQSLITPAMMKDEETKESSEWNALMKQREEAHRQHLKASAEQKDQEVAVEKGGNAGTLEEMEEKIRALKQAEGHDNHKEHHHHEPTEKEKPEDDLKDDDILPPALQEALKHHNYE